jgi:hypothetical protein
MKNILTISLLFIGFIANAQSPVSISKKVATLPTAFEKPNEQTNIYDNEKKTSLPWVVFSDRDENYTYTSPGGTLVMKKIHFMEPFYVSEENNGYIKLIKYQPGMVQGRKLVNKKNSQSYGWISKSKVLLWQSSFIGQRGYPAKYIAIINGKTPLTIPGFYYDKTDSMYVFTSPDLDHKKTKIALNNIVYVYKKSDDGKKMLVGSDDQLIADSAAKSVYGWVAVDAIHNWGDRLYIGSAKTGSAQADDSTAAVINQAIHAGNPASSFFVFDPLINYDEPLLRSLPVIAGGADTSQTLKVGLATDVYDKTNNSIINIKGSHLKYIDYLNIRRNIHHINVVFVIDGGSTMRNYFSGLTSAIQSFEESFTTHSKGNQLKYSAVVYRNANGCTTGGVQSMPFTTDYRNLVQYLDKQSTITAGCSATIAPQPVLNGVNAALNLFKGHDNETNLVVLIGTTASPDYSPGDIAAITDNIAHADARILAIQLFSDYNSIYNDFVIQARQMVSQGAVKLAERKKQRMINGEGLTNAQQFNTSLSDSVSFYLDYPKNSLIQGAVVFPPKGVIKSTQAMRLSLNRFMYETDFDIHTQIHALDSAFRLTGRENRYLQPSVREQLTPVAADLGNNMPHNAFKYYISTTLPANIVSTHAGELQYLLILNDEEYKQLTDILSLMIGENLQQDASDYRSKLFKNYLNIIQKNLDQKKTSRSEIKNITLGEYFQKATGLPLPGKMEFANHKVVDIKHTGDMPQQQFEAYISFLIHSSEKIKHAVLVNQYLISNGKTFFYITQDNLK